MFGRILPAIAGISAFAMVGAASAQAQEQQQQQPRTEGLFASVAGGWNSVDTLEFSTTGFDASVELDGAFSVSGVVGYKYPTGVRTEVELTLRDFDVVAAGANTAVGDAKATSLLGNIVYELPVGQRIKPFLGAGVGYIYLSHDFSALAPGVGGAPVFSIDDDETALAWQGIAGLTVNYTDELAFDVSYRFFDSKKKTFAAMTPTGEASGDYETHSVMFALRWTFNRPAIYDSAL